MASLVQGVLVRWHDRHEVILGAGEPEESPVDLEVGALEDVLVMLVKHVILLNLF